MVHEGLEGCGGITETKEHDSGFVKAERSFEGGLPFVTFPDANVVIPPPYVEFGEVASTLEFVDEVWDEGQRIGIFYCDSVEGSIVLNKSFGAIFFLNKENWNCMWGLGFLNELLLKPFGKGLFKNF